MELTVADHLDDILLVLQSVPNCSEPICKEGYIAYYPFFGREGANKQTKRITIGRKKTDDIVLGDLSISGAHLSITAELQTVQLQTSGSSRIAPESEFILHISVKDTSTNGTWVNDHRIEPNLNVPIQATMFSSRRLIIAKSEPCLISLGRKYSDIDNVFAATIGIAAVPSSSGTRNIHEGLDLLVKTLPFKYEDPVIKKLSISPNASQTHTNTNPNVDTSSENNKNMLIYSLRNQLANCESDKQEIQSQLDTLRIANKKLQSCVDGFKMQVSDLNVRLESYEAHHDQLCSKIDALDNSHQDLNSKYKAEVKKNEKLMLDINSLAEHFSTRITHIIHESMNPSVIDYPPTLEMDLPSQNCHHKETCSPESNYDSLFENDPLANNKKKQLHHITPPVDKRRKKGEDKDLLGGLSDCDFD